MPAWSVVDSVPVHSLVVTACLAAVLVAVAGEALWLASTSGVARLREAPTAVVMGLGSLAVAPIFLGAYRALWPVVGALAPPPLQALVDSHPAVGFAVTFVAWDAAGFAYHRLGHVTRLGWASHQAHHTGSHYDVTLALRQTWLPLPALATFPLVALAGASFEMALASAAVSNLWQALTHTSVAVRLPGWLSAVVVTPATHRIHHSSGAAVNLGAVFTVWDRLAGSYVASGQHSGVAAPPPRPTTGAVATELQGWTELLRGRCRQPPSPVGTPSSSSGTPPSR